MDAEDLLSEWTSGDSSGIRPRRIQRIRDDLSEATGMPVPRRIPEIESWLDRMKSQVTRKLQEAAEDVEVDDE